MHGYIVSGLYICSRSVRSGTGNKFAQFWNFIHIIFSNVIAIFRVNLSYLLWFADLSKVIIFTTIPTFLSICWTFVLLMGSTAVSASVVFFMLLRTLVIISWYSMSGSKNFFIWSCPLLMLSSSSFKILE